MSRSLTSLTALLLALSAEQVGTWADGIGQDLVNIGILTVALSMLVWHCVWVSTHGRQMAMEARQLGASVQGGQRKPWVLFVAVALAVLREGAETVLFVAGSLTGGGQVGTASVMLACALGLVAGAVVGVGPYAGLSRIPTQKLFAATNVLIALLAVMVGKPLGRLLHFQKASNRLGQYARRLIEERNVLALFGFASATLSRPALPFAEKSVTPFLFPFTGADPMRPFNKVLFNLRASYADELEKIDRKSVV